MALQRATPSLLPPTAVAGRRGAEACDAAGAACAGFDAGVTSAARNGKAQDSAAITAARDIRCKR
jgi:hypothetical protein